MGREFEKREDGGKDGSGIPTLSTSPQSLTNSRKRLFCPIKAYPLLQYFNKYFIGKSEAWIISRETDC